ncbi:hypothetical protein [Streptomyces umbrinus]|uniref:hypothetical protein n=1 Tax=Streptomyces umbrinus TaxID=67370 RepID=UPI003427B781
MTTRITPVFALFLIGTGVATGVIGLLGTNDEVTVSGLLMTLTGLPMLIVTTIQNSHRVADYQLAEADTAGYRRALDHVARGLLDQHTAPHPSGGEYATVEHAAGNVIQLRPTHHKGEEQKAL